MLKKPEIVSCTFCGQKADKGDDRAVIVHNKGNICTHCIADFAGFFARHGLTGSNKLKLIQGSKPDKPVVTDGGYAA